MLEKRVVLGADDGEVVRHYGRFQGGDNRDGEEKVRRSWRSSMHSACAPVNHGGGGAGRLWGPAADGLYAGMSGGCGPCRFDERVASFLTRPRMSATARSQRRNRQTTYAPCSAPFDSQIPCREVFYGTFNALLSREKCIATVQWQDVRLLHPGILDGRRFGNGGGGPSCYRPSRKRPTTTVHVS